jgi:membrane protease YdiL (CAAX protease family)
LAAGLGEELAYRGYAILALAPLTGTLGAAAVTTVVFAVMHAYQGRLGVVRTGVMGAVLAAGFLATGSILPSILAHASIDVLAGVVLGERLLSPERAPGV